MWNILSCKRHSELACHKLDRKLTVGENIFYHVHRVICLLCRRFERQMNIIQNGAKEFAEIKEFDLKLSPESRLRIKESLGVK